MSARVFDSNGNEIEIGASVRCLPGVAEGEVYGIDWLGDGEVYVAWPGQRYSLPIRSRRRFTRERSYRCRSLEVVSDCTGTSGPTEEEERDG